MEHLLILLFSLQNLVERKLTFIKGENILFPKNISSKYSFEYQVYFPMVPKLGFNRLYGI